MATVFPLSSHSRTRIWRPSCPFVSAFTANLSRELNDVVSPRRSVAAAGVAPFATPPAASTSTRTECRPSRPVDSKDASRTLTRSSPARLSLRVALITVVLARTAAANASEPDPSREPLAPAECTREFEPDARPPGATFSASSSDEKSLRGGGARGGASAEDASSGIGIGIGPGPGPARGAGSSDLAFSSRLGVN